MDAMKQWYAGKPHLFTEMLRNRLGPDTMIAVSGAPGAGATFSFTVVVGYSKPPAASEEAPKSALAGRRFGGARLPTVEDDRNDQQATAGHPEKPGIAVSPAADPAAIGALLARLRPFSEEHERVPDDLLRELAALARVRPSVAPLARLLRQIDDFDHDGALATLAQIAARLGIAIDPIP